MALVVFGLVMAGLAQSFRFGLTAWHVAARASTDPENMAALELALSRMITQAQPGSVTGRAHDLALTAKLQAGAGAGLEDAEIFTTPAGDAVLRDRPHPPGIPLIPPQPPRDTTLASGVAALNFEYLTKTSGAPGAWSSSWSGAGLPALVRIHFDFIDHRIWPDLVAAPIAAGP